MRQGLPVTCAQQPRCVQTRVPARPQENARGAQEGRSQPQADLPGLRRPGDRRAHAAQIDHNAGTRDALPARGQSAAKAGTASTLPTVATLL